MATEKWEVVLRGRPDRTVMISDNPHLDDPRIAKVYGDSSKHAMERARQMAAAPDLLGAARRALSALAANGAPNCEAAKELRSAIAKAEGRSA
jgi:hypothetical protein